MSEAVSVIIPSYNGRGKLPAILQSLDNQSISDFEVIVVLDGSTDDSLNFLESYRPVSYTLKTIVQPNKGRSQVRNRGVEVAKGSILVFFDDDMRMEPDCLVGHLDFHTKVDRAVYGGNQLEKIEEAKNDFDRFRCWLRSRWMDTYQQMTRIDETNIYLTAAHFSIQKGLFVELGGFDENLKDHEDRDFALQAIKRNVPVYFDPANVAWHDDFVSPEQYIKRREEYLIAFQLQGIFPEYSLASKVLFWFFGRQYWLKKIKGERLLQLPIAVRYKIYYWVIWGMALRRVNHALVVV